MRAPAAGLLILLALLTAAPVATAQTGGGGAFGPLPQAQPEPPPPPEAPGAADDGDVSRETLYLIAAAVLLAFILLGAAITRDARGRLTEDDRAIVEGRPASNPMRKQESAKLKQRQREKTRRQKKARKKTRGANRG